MVFHKGQKAWNKGLIGYLKGLPRWNSGLKGYTNKGSFKKGQVTWNKGLTKKDLRVKKYSDKRIGQHHTEESKDKIRNTKFQKWKNGEYKINKISRAELKVKEYLESNNIPFIMQYVYPLGFADFYLPKNNLIIQCYGTYWHSLPKYIERDEKQNRWFKDNGYNILILNSERVLKEGIKEVCDYVRTKNA